MFPLRRRKNQYFETKGICPICDSKVIFSSSDPWFRDHLRCSKCKSLPRQRALYSVLNQYYPNWRDLHIHESSPGNSRANKKIFGQCKNYIETQYDKSIPFGTTHHEHGYRSENLEEQTFPDEAFDLVITQDVFEHIFHPDIAIREIDRTLKSGGAHILTVPIVRKSLPSRRRASINKNGEISYLFPAQYHGNPIDREGGSLVTIDWGYDILSYFSHHSNLSCSLIYIDDMSRGIKAEFIEVLICQKQTIAAL